MRLMVNVLRCRADRIISNKKLPKTKEQHLYKLIPADTDSETADWHDPPSGHTLSEDGTLAKHFTVIGSATQI